MKEQIIEILKNNSIKVSDITGDYKILEDDMFPQVAEEIVKLINDSVLPEGITVK